MKTIKIICAASLGLSLASQSRPCAQSVPGKAISQLAQRAGVSQYPGLIPIPGAPAAAEFSLFPDRKNNGRSMLDRCESVLNNIDSIDNMDILGSCAEFYWHRGKYDEVIKLGYRAIALDPRDESVYALVSFLLHSKWVVWNTNPDNMPDGESKKEESIRIFENGMKYNEGHAEFYLEYAHHMFVCIKDWEKSIELYKLVDKYANGKKIMKVRARKNIAHSYRLMGRREDAIAWYKAVLEIDPQNNVAVKWLKKLEG